MFNIAVAAFLFMTLAFADDPAPGETVYFSNTTTIYSLPGYDYKSYKEAEENGTFDQFRSLGLQDLIPEKLSWPTKGDPAKFISKHSEKIYAENGEQLGDYYLIEYESINQGLVRGYIESSTVRQQSLGNERVIAENANCNLCSKHNINTVCQANVFQDLTNVLNSYPDDFKNDEELEEYFYTYRGNCRSREFNLYTSEYKTYVKEAAKAFQIPEAMLACLLFKENQFMNRRTSTAGARGIAQIIPSTISYMNGVLKKLEYSEQTVETYNQRITEYQSLVRENVQLKKQGKPTKTIPSWKRGNYEDAKTRMYELSLASKYPEYIDAIRNSEGFKKRYKNGLPWTGQYPTRFNSRRAEEPALAIGASAMYLKHIMNQFSKEIPKESLQGKDQHLNFLTAVTGAYNMGAGNAFRFIGQNPSSNAADWVNEMSRSAETKKHMLSIRRCMQKNNNQPPKEYRNGKLVDQNAC